MQMKAGLFFIAYKEGAGTTGKQPCPFHSKPLYRAWNIGRADARKGVAEDSNDGIQERLRQAFEDTPFWAELFSKETVQG